MFAMFGKQRRTEETNRRADAPAPAPVVRRPKSTKNSRRTPTAPAPSAPPAPAPTPAPTPAPVVRKPKSTKESPVFLPPPRAHATVGTGRTDSSYHPADELVLHHERNEEIDVTHVPKCQMYDWMVKVTKKLKKPKGWKPQFPVYMIPRTLEYIFNVCITYKEQVEKILAAIRTESQLSYIFPYVFYFELAGNPRNIKLYRELIDRFLEFVTGDCMVAYMEIHSEGFHHARALFKDPATRKMYVIDPIGKNAPRHDQLFIPLLSAFVRHCSPSYTGAEFKQGRRDQRNEEDACGAIIFTRIVFAAYKAKKYGHSPMDYIYPPLPCLFALFVSDLFQRADVITEDTHKRVQKAVRTKLLKERDRDRALQAEERQVEQQMRIRAEEEEETKDDIY